MITLIVAFITSALTTGGLYYILNRLAPAQTAATLTAAKAAVETDISTETKTVAADVAKKV